MQTAEDQDSVCGVIGFEVSGWGVRVQILRFFNLYRPVLRFFNLYNPELSSGIRNHIPSGAEAQRDADSPDGSGFSLWGYRVEVSGWGFKSSRFRVF